MINAAKVRALKPVEGTRDRTRARERVELSTIREQRYTWRNPVEECRLVDSGAYIRTVRRKDGGS